MRKWIVVVAVSGLMAGAPWAAEAKPPRLLASTLDSGDWPVPDAYGSVERPRRIFYRVTMDPGAPAHGKARITCERGVRRVSREYVWTESASFERTIPMDPLKPASCTASIDFYYDDFDQVGTVQLDLYATQYRKKRKRR